jgi:hypothetical protein
MKDTFYFTHDYNARCDDKIKMLIRKHGMIGYGIFWAIIEDLYNNANALRTDYEGIAYELRTDEITIKSIITEFELFTIDNGLFGSLSVQRRLEERNEKSLKAKKSAFKRWNKDANALPTQSDSNAIKERKGKEINNNLQKAKIEIQNSSDLESHLMKTKMSKEIALNQLDIFISEKAITKEHEFSPGSEIKRHFFNWLRKQKPNNDIVISNQNTKSLSSKILD